MSPNTLLLLALSNNVFSLTLLTFSSLTSSSSYTLLLFSSSMYLLHLPFRLLTSSLLSQHYPYSFGLSLTLPTFTLHSSPSYFPLFLLTFRFSSLLSTPLPYSPHFLFTFPSPLFTFLTFPRPFLILLVFSLFSSSSPFSTYFLCLCLILTLSIFLSLSSFSLNFLRRLSLLTFLLSMCFSYPPHCHLTLQLSSLFLPSLSPPFPSFHPPLRPSPIPQPSPRHHAALFQTLLLPPSLPSNTHKKKLLLPHSRSLLAIVFFCGMDTYCLLDLTNNSYLFAEHDEGFDASTSLLA